MYKQNHFANPIREVISIHVKLMDKKDLDDINIPGFHIIIFKYTPRNWFNEALAWGYINIRHKTNSLGVQGRDFHIWVLSQVNQGQ